MSTSPATRSRQPRLFEIENPLPARLGYEFFRSLPAKPGVYSFLGNSGEILYIGQSSNLKARVGSYRHVTPEQHPRRTLRLVQRTARIEWRECASARDAIDLERALLLAHRPPFNRAGVWQPPPWWFAVEGRAGRLHLDLLREPAAVPQSGDVLLRGPEPPRGIGPLPSAFRHAYASLARWVCRCALPAADMKDFPHGVFQSRLPLSLSLQVTGAEELAAEIEEWAHGRPVRLLRRLEAAPCVDRIPGREYWSEELERLRKWAARVSSSPPNELASPCS